MPLFTKEQREEHTVRVTEVRMKLVKNLHDTKLKGYADITLEGVFVVHGMKLLQGKDGLFVAMPSKRTHGGEFKDFFEKSNNKKEILKTINSCDICIVLSNSWKKYFE